MYQIGLSLEEADLLRVMLEGCLSDLRTELRHTDNREYRNMLKRQEAIFRRIAQRLEAEAHEPNILIESNLVSPAA